MGTQRTDLTGIMKNCTVLKSFLSIVCVLILTGTARAAWDDPEHGDVTATNPEPAHVLSPAAKLATPQGGYGATPVAAKQAPTAPTAPPASPAQLVTGKPPSPLSAANSGATGTNVRSKAAAKSQVEAKSAKAAETDDGPVDADKALTLLKEGNAHWLSGTLSNPNISVSRRQTLAEAGQKPFATVLTCSDSRLPVERLFDRGVGDVFVVRVAGNIAGDSEAGTIEYGLAHLKTPLLVVMGHTKCGAVAAAASGAALHGKVAKLVASCAPAVERAKRANPSATGNELVTLAVKENVWQTIFDLLKTSDEIRELAVSGNVKIVGAMCDITTGKVEFLGEHPWQSELLSALEQEGKSEKTETASKPNAPAPTGTATATEGKSGH